MIFLCNPPRVWMSKNNEEGCRHWDNGWGMCGHLLNGKYSQILRLSTEAHFIPGETISWNWFLVSFLHCSSVNQSRHVRSFLKSFHFFCMNLNIEIHSSFLPSFFSFLSSSLPPFPLFFPSFLLSLLLHLLSIITICWVPTGARHCAWLFASLFIYSSPKQYQVVTTIPILCTRKLKLREVV